MIGGITIGMAITPYMMFGHMLNRQSPEKKIIMIAEIAQSTKPTAILILLFLSINISLLIIVQKRPRAEANCQVCKFCRRVIPFL